MRSPFKFRPVKLLTSDGTLSTAGCSAQLNVFLPDGRTLQVPLSPKHLQLVHLSLQRIHNESVVRNNPLTLRQKEKLSGEILETFDLINTEPAPEPTPEAAQQQEQG